MLVLPQNENVGHCRCYVILFAFRSVCLYKIMVSSGAKTYLYENIDLYTWTQSCFIRQICMYMYMKTGTRISEYDMVYENFLNTEWVFRNRLSENTSEYN